MRAIALAAAVLVAASCGFVDRLLHDEKIVAEVGDHKLYLSDLESVLPAGLSPEDSTILASQYVQSWVGDQLMMDLATRHLSKEEMDVSRELDDYRHSLLKYRYEQHYVNERLDTAVTDNEVEEYYNAHKELFRLDVPILKVRYVDIMKDSPNYDAVRRRLTSSKYDDLVELDSLAYASAIRYFDSTQKWVDAVSLAKEFELDYVTMLSYLWGSLIEKREERGDVKVAYVTDLRRAGNIAPLDYCGERIRDIIISARKRELLADLERDLLKDGLDSKNVIIY